MTGGSGFDPTGGRGHDHRSRRRSPSSGGRRVHRVPDRWVGLPGGRHLQGTAVPAAGLGLGVGWRAALGSPDALTGAGHPGQSVLRRRRVRPLPLPPGGGTGRDGPDEDHRVAPGRTGRVIHDHHPAYISWDDYLAKQPWLAANLTHAGARPPREGAAVCQGIISCGACGRPMSIRYHGNRHAASTGCRR